jgi:signal transduction histidine kinase
MKTVIKKFAIDLRIRVGYGTAFLLLLISYLLTLYANSELIKQAKLVDHSNKVIIDVQCLISAMKDAETGQRGYLLIKDMSFLEPYGQSKDVVDSILRILQNETWADPRQQTSLNTLRLLIDKKYQTMDSTIAGFNRHNHELTDPLVLKSFFGKELMDHIRTTVAEMQSAEQTRLKERSEVMTSSFVALNTIIITSLAIAILIAIYGFFTYSRENKARRAADVAVFEYQEQLKEQIQELDKANKELIQVRSIEKFAATGRIARTIAHEIRNPLTNINLAVDQLKAEGTDAPEDPVIMLDMITRNSARINQLITDLLNSTKFTELAPKSVSINKLLDDTLELAKDRIQLHNTTVSRSYAADICDVSVDPEKMTIAFLNIIVNAIEAMEPGKGILQIKTTSANGKCVVTISDNGIGMDKESVSKIFEPYFTSKAKGSGLGLTNTQNIILNHNGHIHIESEKGKGTSFTISLDFV